VRVTIEGVILRVFREFGYYYFRLDGLSFGEGIILAYCHSRMCLAGAY